MNQQMRIRNVHNFRVLFALYIGVTSHPKIENSDCKSLFNNANNTLEKVKVHILIRAQVTHIVLFFYCNLHARVA